MSGLRSWEGSHLIQSIYGRRKTTMNAEYSIIHNRSQSQVVENLAAISPNVDGSVLPQAFVVKPVHLGNLPALVVPPNKGHSIWVSDLQSSGVNRGVENKGRQKEATETLEPSGLAITGKFPRCRSLDRQNRLYVASRTRSLCRFKIASAKEGRRQRLAHEDEVGLRALSANFKQLLQIKKLSMYVTAYLRHTVVALDQHRGL